jgi:hypothetical protein
MRKVQAALEKAGIEFLDGDGFDFTQNPRGGQERQNEQHQDIMA